MNDPPDEPTDPTPWCAAVDRCQARGLPLGAWVDKGVTKDIRTDGMVLKLCSDPAWSTELLDFATDLRTQVPFTSSQADVRPPLQFAWDEGLIFRFSQTVWVSPVTESFRRHILLICQRPDTLSSASCYEVVLPGEHPDRRRTYADRRIAISRQLCRYGREVPACQEPVAVVRFAEGTVRLYGRNIVCNRHTGLEGVVFKYTHDGKRLDHITPKAIECLAETARMSPHDTCTELLRQVIWLTDVTHRCGYVGNEVPIDRGNDPDYDHHTGNFRVTISRDAQRLECQVVGDFESFLSANATQAHPCVWHQAVLFDRHQIAHGIRGLADILGPFACFDSVPAWEERG